MKTHHFARFSLLKYASLLALSSLTMIAHAGPTVAVSTLLDRFRTCSIDLRYDEQTMKLTRELQNSPDATRGAVVKDGYAALKLQVNFHGLPISQLLVPTKLNTWTQYQVRIEALPDKARHVLQRLWNVEFEPTGPDGMDNSVAISYRTYVGTARVRLFSASANSRVTLLECNP